MRGRAVQDPVEVTAQQVQGGVVGLAQDVRGVVVLVDGEPFTAMTSPVSIPSSM